MKTDHSLILQNIGSILLIQLGDIGDVVLTFPAMKALRDYFPHAEITVAVRHKAKDLLEDCPWIDGVISIDQQKRSVKEEIAYQWKFFSNLRSHKFDLAIDMRTGTRGAILAFLSGASQRISFYADDGKLWRNRLFTHLTRLDYRLGQYVGDYYSSILNVYDILTQSGLPIFPISPQKQLLMKTLLQNENIPTPFIVIQPFSLWQYKELKAENYAELIRRIHSEYQLPIIITGSPDEKNRAEEIIRQTALSESAVHNFAGKTSLGTLAAILAASRLFIGVDSAGIHIAASVGTPTISIFGPSASASWAPRGERHIVVSNPQFSCIPCRNKGCENTEISRCLLSLGVDEVMKAVRLQMEKFSA